MDVPPRSVARGKRFLRRFVQQLFRMALDFAHPLGSLQKAAHQLAHIFGCGIHSEVAGIQDV